MFLRVLHASTKVVIPLGLTLAVSSLQCLSYCLQQMIQVSGTALAILPDLFEPT